MFFLSIDIGGTFIKYGLVDREGNLSDKGKISTPKTSFQAMVETLIWLYESFSLQEVRLEGIALSVPAPVQVDTGLIEGEGSLPFMMGRSLKAALEEALGVTVHNENDGNCAALAEVWKGKGQPYEDLLLVVCGTGIGGAVVKSKKIHRGKNLFAGEFGYMLSQYQYETGEVAIWSHMASLGALVDFVAKKRGVEKTSLSGEIIFDEAERGEPVAKEAVDRFYVGMAIGLHNLQYTYDPEVILLGGGVSSRPEFVLEIEMRLKGIYDKMGNPKVRPVLMTCAFENDANLLGAAYHAMQHF